MSLARNHSALKAVRGRGTETQTHSGALELLKRLEQEMRMVRAELDCAWLDLNKGKDWRKFQRHSDAAQQRLHKAIKRLGKR